MAEQIPDCQIFFNNAGEHPLMWSWPELFQAIAWTILHLLARVAEGSAAAYEL